MTYNTYMEKNLTLTPSQLTLLAEDLADIDAARAARLEARAQEYFDSWEDGDEDDAE